MNGRVKTIVAFALGLFFAGAAAADTLELKDGRILHGRYLGGTQAVLRFEIRGEVQTTLNVSDAVALTFTGNSGATNAPARSHVPPPPSDYNSKRLQPCRTSCSATAYCVARRSTASGETNFLGSSGARPSCSIRRNHYPGG